MKIFYDGLIYDIYKSRPGGISNFFDQLISIVSDEYPSLLTSTRPIRLPHPSGANLTTVRFDAPVRPGRFRPLLRDNWFSIKTKLFNPNIIHPTYYKDPSLFKPGIPLVYTAHDMIHEKWSSQKDPAKEFASLKYKCFASASAIPCVSKSTQKDLLELYPHLEGKTSVIYLAGGLSEYSIPFRVPDRSCPKLLDYMLYVGDRRSYKNFTRMLLAFKATLHAYPDLMLKVVGAPLSVDEQDLVDALELCDMLDIRSDVSTPELVSLYRDAICLIYPSLYEGFGIPILEAMSLGVPVITSNTSSIPEVAGDAALYVNPADINELRDSMVLLMSNHELRRELQIKGSRRADLFSWKKTAEQYIDLYLRLLHASKPAC